MLRILPVVFVLSACGILGMSSEEAQSLARYQKNAALYWEGGRIGQALDQVRRGLEIDPDDYKLHTIRAWCFLQQSAVRPARLDEAYAQFRRVMELRDRDEQGPQALLGWGMCLQKLGLVEREKAGFLREEIERHELSGAELAVEETRLSEHEANAAQRFREAERQFQALVDRGDQLLAAHYHLMQTKALRDDYAGSVRAGKAYLARAADEQERLRRRLQRTTVIGYEKEVRANLRRMRDQELAVRAFLANLHYDAGNHELAVRELDRVLLMDPSRSNDYYHRALSLQALGRTEEARRDFEKFLATTRLPQGSEQVTRAVEALGRTGGAGK